MSSSSEGKSSGVKEDGLLDRLARTFGGGNGSGGKDSKSKAKSTPASPKQLPTPSISRPSSPRSMTQALTDAILSPLSQSSSVPPTPLPIFGAELRRTESTSSVSSSIKRRIALSGVGVADFLKKLGKDIASIGGGKGAATTESSGVTVEVTRRKSIDEPRPSQDPAQQWSPPAYGHAKLLSMVAEGEEPEASDHEGSSDEETEESHQKYPLPSTSTAHYFEQPPLPSPEDDDHLDLSDPAVLAHRLQSLIDALPTPAPLPPNSPPPSAPPSRTIPLPPEDTPTTPPSTPRSPRKGGKRRALPIVPSKPPPPKRDKNGKPIPPPGAAPKLPDEDRELLRLLQSATIMNGGKEKEAGRTTVWDILQRIGIGKEDGDQDGSGGDGQRGGGGGQDTPYADTGSVMLYSPLIPTKADLVELAEVAPVYYEEEIPEEELLGMGEPRAGKAKAEEAVIPVGGWVKTMWPLAGWFSATQEAEAEKQPDNVATPEIMVSPPTASPPELPRSPYIGSPRLYHGGPNDLALSPYIGSPRAMPRSPYMGANELPRSPYMGSPRPLHTAENGELVDEGGKRFRIKEAKAWVPSADKVSYEVMWWGYRVYLPPPAMLVLNDKTIEAQKRAALITAALTWFFNNIPIDILPLPLQPTVMLLQRLAPYLGYIGTFISWSWNQVRSYDVGYGVILSATWLFPIALIPGTWYENQFPKSPTTSPVPLPPEDLPASPPPSTPQPLPSPSTPTSPAPSYPGSPLPCPEPSPPTSPPPSTPTSPLPIPIGEPSETVPPTPTQPPTETIPSTPTPAEPPEAEDDDGANVPWSPDVGISPNIGHGRGTKFFISSPSSVTSSVPSSPSMSPSSVGGKALPGHKDKKGWGRFQVLRGAPKGLFDNQSYAVAPAASGSAWGETPPVSPAPSKRELVGSGVGSPAVGAGEVWATPAQGPPAVLPGSPLMDELLKSKRVRTVELPGDEGSR